MENKLSNKIYKSIQNDILSGAIDDQTFLTEKDLADRYQVSKAPVRDALHLLCGQGYLISYPRKGYMVHRYSRKDIQQMQEVRLHLEKLSVKLAIENASDDAIKVLQKFIKQESRATDPSMTSNARFHISLAELSGNPYLVESLRKLVNNISRYWIQLEQEFPHHSELIDALLDRDLERALRILEEDLSDA